MSEFLRLLLASLNEEIVQSSDHVVRGYAASYDDYRHRIGKIEGLRRAIELAEAIEKKLNS